MNTERITKVFSGAPFYIMVQAIKYAEDNDMILLTTRKDVDERAKQIFDKESIGNRYLRMDYECVFVKCIKEENNMMNNETITITRNGKTYEVDFEKAEELGVLKEKVEYPKSWGDLWKFTSPGYYHEARTYTTERFDIFKDINETKSFIALGKLIQLRDWWWDNMCDGWRPESFVDTYIIMRKINECGDPIIDTDESWCDSYTLSFPTGEIRDKFLETYNDLIIEAKMFL